MSVFDGHAVTCRNTLFFCHELPSNPSRNSLLGPVCSKGATVRYWRLNSQLVVRFIEEVDFDYATADPATLVAEGADGAFGLKHLAQAAAIRWRLSRAAGCR
jgi:hypothetical protein